MDIQYIVNKIKEFFTHSKKIRLYKLQAQIAITNEEKMKYRLKKQTEYYSVAFRKYEERESILKDKIFEYEELIRKSKDATALRQLEEQQDKYFQMLRGIEAVLSSYKETWE